MAENHKLFNNEKINVYEAQDEVAIDVFDISSSGTKPDGAILVTTGTYVPGAISVNVTNKIPGSLGVKFVGGDSPVPPEPPGPTPQGYRYYMWVGTSSYGVDDFNNIFVEASDIAFYPKNESAMTGFNGITGSYATESEPYTNFYDGDINSNWPTLRVEGNNSAVNIFDVGRNVDISAYAIVAENRVGAGHVKNRTPVCWSLYGRTDYSNNSADDGWNLIETREAPYLANRMDDERVYKFIINGWYKAYSNNKYPELSPSPLPPPDDDED